MYHVCSVVESISWMFIYQKKKNHLYECHENWMSCPSCKIVWSYLLVNACSSFGLLNDHYKINQLIVCTLQLSFVKVRREILECQIMKILLCIFKQINRLKKNKIEIPYIYLYNKKKKSCCLCTLIAHVSSFTKSNITITFVSILVNIARIQMTMCRYTIMYNCTCKTKLYIYMYNQILLDTYFP